MTWIQIRIRVKIKWILRTTLQPIKACKVRPKIALNEAGILGRLYLRNPSCEIYEIYEINDNVFHGVADLVENDPISCGSVKIWNQC